MSTYPENPGWRAGSLETSRLAALDVAPTAPRMMDRVLAVLETGPATPEEIQAELSGDGERVLLNSVRARVCQLHAQGRVKDTGERGLGESQRSKAIRWRLATAHELSDFIAAKAAADDGSGEGGR